MQKFYKNPSTIRDVYEGKINEIHTMDALSILDTFPNSQVQYKDILKQKSHKTPSKNFMILLACVYVLDAMESERTY